MDEIDPLCRLSGSSTPQRCIVTPWKATVKFQRRSEKCWAPEFPRRLLCHHSLALVGGVTVKSQALGDVTILLFIRQANCLVEISRPRLAAAAAAAAWRESVHKIVKPHSSESKATSPQRRRASQLAEKHNNSKNKKKSTICWRTQRVSGWIFPLLSEPHRTCNLWLERITFHYAPSTELTFI